MKILKNQNGFGLIEGLLIVIALTLIAFVGFYVYNANKEEPKISDSYIQKNTEDNNQKKDDGPTADWQVYEDELGFNIKYPKDWKYVAKGTKAGGGEYASNEFLPAANFPDDNSSIITFEKHESDLTAEEFANQSGVKFDGNVGNSKLISSESSKINGYSAYTLKGKIYGGVSYFVYIANKGVVVEFNYYDDDYSDIYKSIVDSIQFNN